MVEYAVTDAIQEYTLPFLLAKCHRAHGLSPSIKSYFHVRESQGCGLGTCQVFGRGAALAVFVELSDTN